MDGRGASSDDVLKPTVISAGWAAARRAGSRGEWRPRAFLPSGLSPDLLLTRRNPRREGMTVACRRSAKMKPRAMRGACGIRRQESSHSECGIMVGSCAGTAKPECLATSRVVGATLSLYCACGMKSKTCSWRLVKLFIMYASKAYKGPLRRICRSISNGQTGYSFRMGGCSKRISQRASMSENRNPPSHFVTANFEPLNIGLTLSGPKRRPKTLSKSNAKDFLWIDAQRQGK
jgi:hypothetical protein